MKLVIESGTPPDATAFTVVDDSSIAFDGLEREDTHQFQIESLIRAEKQRVFDRGNKLTAIGFNVTLRHESTYHALRYILQDVDEVPRHGKITLSHTEGGRTFKVTWDPASISGLRLIRHRGVVTVWNFRLTIGAPTI